MKLVVLAVEDRTTWLVANTIHSVSKSKIKGQQATVMHRNYTAGVESDSLFFADVYHAEIKILGNPVFTPQMLVYIDPRAMGLGMVDIDPRDFMSELGIGGYYRIFDINHNYLLALF